MLVYLLHAFIFLSLSVNPNDFILNFFVQSESPTCNILQPFQNTKIIISQELFEIMINTIKFAFTILTFYTHYLTESVVY